MCANGNRPPHRTATLATGQGHDALRAGARWLGAAGPAHAATRLDGLAGGALGRRGRTGRWPGALTHGYTALVPKEGPPGALNTRPLTSLSIVYRLWAGVWLQEAIGEAAAVALPARSSEHTRPQGESRDRCSSQGCCPTPSPAVTARRCKVRNAPRAACRRANEQTKGAPVAWCCCGHNLASRTSLEVPLPRNTSSFATGSSCCTSRSASQSPGSHRASKVSSASPSVVHATTCPSRGSAWLAPGHAVHQHRPGGQGFLQCRVTRVCVTRYKENTKRSNTLLHYPLK